jgi:phosphoribosyl 1,2-cyclic phosphodiesterase
MIPLRLVALLLAEPLQISFDFGPPPALRPGPRPGGPPLRVVVLGSGSAGNAVVIECGAHRILLDAGFSCRELVKRMTAMGVDPETLSALVLTHEHGDHCRGVVRMMQRYGLPLYASEGTLQGIRLPDKVRKKVTVIASGAVTEIGGFEVEPFLIPHDAREPVGLVIETAAGHRVGLAADLGTRSQLAWGRLADLDVFLLETNHDLDMLRNGPYPWALKQRVAGRHGHLSNREAADGLPELLGDRLRHVVPYHLSRTNNLPALAAAAVAEVLEREGSRAEIVVSEQDNPTPWLEVHV